jgi:hypothetical protein
MATGMLNITAMGGIRQSEIQRPKLPSAAHLPAYLKANQTPGN